MKKKRTDWKRLAFMAVSFGPLVVIGLLSGFPSASVTDRWPMTLICVGLGWYLGFIFQILIHELGHMVGGLISGYRFCSFRVGSVIFIKQEKGVRVARFSLAGTGGQCLMSPPDMVDGRIPTTLYNLSGVIANLLSAAVCAAVYIFMPGSAVGAVCAIIGMIGLYFAVTNGIPMNTGMLDNDGRNAIFMRRDKASQRAFWLQLKVNELSTNGVRIKDMPAEWFEVPSDEEMKNTMCAAVGVLCCARLMDEMRLSEADALMRRFLRMKTGINAIHRAALVCDRMFIELTGENRPLVIKRMLTATQLKVMKMMKTQPSVLRTWYALNLLYDNDSIKAQKTLEDFEKVASNYPQPQDIEGERELIALAKRRWEEKLTQSTFE